MWPNSNWRNTWYYHLIKRGKETRQVIFSKEITLSKIISHLLLLSIFFLYTHVLFISFTKWRTLIIFKRGENVEYNYDNHVLLFHYYLEKIEQSVRGDNLGFLQLRCWKYWTWKEQNNKSKNSRTNLIINEKNRKKIAKELVYTQSRRK